MTFRTILDPRRTPGTLARACALVVAQLLWTSRAHAALMPAEGNIAGTVTDSASAQPLQGADVSVVQNGRIVANTTADAFGRYVVRNLAAGRYSVLARFIGYRPDSASVVVPEEGGTVQATFRMVAVPLQLQAVEVRGAATPIAVNTRTGDQVFKQNEYHGAPTNTTSQILQQSIAGAARAPTGEVHIRGQHAEYTYYVDGVPVPSGISGSLNELFDPSVVNQIQFETGGWDAEYGGKNAAVINVTTKIPTGGFHLDLSSYGGSFNSSGEGAALSANRDKWGFFVSGAHQYTSMRREPLVADPTTDQAVNFHNSGTDWFGFAKVQYTPGANDVVNLEGNWSQTRFAVPYDSTGGLVLDDHQRDRNGFLNLGWRHQSGDSTGSGSPAELFAGFFYRNGSLLYTPGATDQPSFIFFPDTTPYNLHEDRSFNTYGVKLDYGWSAGDIFDFKVGTLSSFTTGHEAFVTTDVRGNTGPSSVSNLSGNDVGVYAQTAISPTEKWELRTGVRYDEHTAPFAGTQHQVSPRVKLSFFPTPATTLYAYYGRLFVPTNVEDLRAITEVADSGVTAAPTLPERDHFFEVGLVHRFPVGVVAKFSAYHKRSSPGIDDNTVPGSAIVTSVNIAEVRISGIESVIEIRPPGPVTGYVNVALNHAYGRGPITGGFFPAETPQGFFDLDHDQRLSAVASVNYSPNRFFASLTGIYGSGLTNGLDPAECDCSYGTGLFDFNGALKVKPSFVLNASAGYSIDVGSTVVTPQLYVDNVFDRKYLLKGTFFSGPSVGRPRSVQLRVNVGL